jgi:hypothetical protein
MANIQTLTTETDIIPRFIEKGYFDMGSIIGSMNKYTVVSSHSKPSHRTMTKMKNGVKQTERKEEMRMKLLMKLEQKKLTN